MGALVMLVSLTLHVVNAMRDEAQEAKGRTCGCLNKASDTEVKGLPGDCQKENVKV